MSLYNNKDHCVYTLNIVYNYKTYLIPVVIFCLVSGYQNIVVKLAKKSCFFFNFKNKWLNLQLVTVKTHGRLIDFTSIDALTRYIDAIDYKLVAQIPDSYQRKFDHKNIGKIINIPHVSKQYPVSQSRIYHKAVTTDFICLCPRPNEIAPINFEVSN